MTTPSDRVTLIMIGASWGGLHALSALVNSLPKGFCVPIAIVQHRRRDAGTLLGQLLQDQSELVVTEVEDKEPIAEGHVYIAPADYHLLVDRDHFTLSLEEPVRFSRPSIDVAFTSAADTCGRGVLGVVLTGANEDGAHGLQTIVARGGRAIVQDPEDAEVGVMPAAALRAVPSAEVLPLKDIGPRLGELCGIGASTRKRRKRGSTAKP